jgi:hypothetical protein
VEVRLRARLYALAGMLGLLAACGEDAFRDPSEPPTLRADGGFSHPRVLDADADGLCDSTEADLGTDPNEVDSDGDGIPDIIELVAGLEPVMPADPAPDQLVYLPGARGAAVDFETRFTVEGDGQGLSGWFGALGTLYRDGDSADLYHVGSTALQAAPIDAARSIEAGSARFEAVLGKTRLSFLLRFEFGDRAERTCNRAYPFRYAIKSDDGQTRGERTYLLVVGAAGATQVMADTFCLPSGCD